MNRFAGADPVRVVGWWLRWALIPALLGVLVSGNVDTRALPLVGPERKTAVLLLDGQAYFGHLDDSGESGTLVLRDAYYFQDATGGVTNLGVGLVKRGGEAHEPADGMRINRDKVLAVERVGANSSVARAIAVERQLSGASPPALSLNPPAIAGADGVAAQRIAAEHNLARGFAASVGQLGKLNELVLPIPKAEAQAITEKAIEDLRTVRRNGLAAIANALGMLAADTEAYVNLTDARLEGQSFANEAGVLLAPQLFAIVSRVSTLYAQVGDAAAKQITQPRAQPSPSPSPSPSPTPRR